MKKILNSNWMPWNSWPMMAVSFLFAIGVIAYVASPDKDFDRKHGITRLPLGQTVKVITYDEVEYLVVRDSHGGLGICKK